MIGTGCSIGVFISTFWKAGHQKHKGDEVVCRRTWVLIGLGSLSDLNCHFGMSNDD